MPGLRNSVRLIRQRVVFPFWTLMSEREKCLPHVSEPLNKNPHVSAATTTRMIVTSMVAIAVMVQSFGIAGQMSCVCASTESCAATGDAQCHCSEALRNEKSCCCSQRCASDQMQSSTPCCQSELGCCDSTEKHRCHCGCSDHRRNPVTPADNTLQSVNWELLLARLNESTLTDNPRLTLYPVAATPGVRFSSLHCSMQTLYCTWLT